jgi:hypothetical protein
MKNIHLSLSNGKLYSAQSIGDDSKSRNEDQVLDAISVLVISFLRPCDLTAFVRLV